MKKGENNMLNIPTGTLGRGGRFPNLSDNENNVKIEASYNLIDFLLKKKYPITISGKAGAGKTTFVANLIEKFYSEQKIGIIEPFDELKPILSQRIENVILSFRPDGIDADKLVRYDLNLLIVGEAQTLKDYNLIKTINTLGIPVIAIQQSFKEKEITAIGNHIAVTIENFVFDRKIGKIEEVDH
jgi:GTPase SAR1 family protein